MRFILAILLLGLSAFAACSAAAVPKDQVQKQKQLWLLFKHITQPSYYKEHLQIADTFHFWEHPDYYTKPEVVQHFEKYWKYGMLPKGEIFSVFYEKHLNQAIDLFKLFYYAKDYETFYQTAVWARNHVNEYMFLYAFSVAIVHRPDTYYVMLPPIHEINPYYFFSTDVIFEAQKYKQMWYGKYMNQEQTDFAGYTIFANYTGDYVNVHPEQSLSYFMEDVGINSYFYYFNIYYPWWMSSEEFGLKYDHRGELFYYMIQQLMGRFYLERLSNDFGEIPWFNWDVPFETGYYPSLMYPNGLEFPTRPHFAHLHEYFFNYGEKWTKNSWTGYSYTKVTNYERRILDTIDRGFFYTKDGKKMDLFTTEGFNFLGNMIQGNYESPSMSYFGWYPFYAHHLLGYSYEPLGHHKVFPSAMEHYETTLRDPAFWQFYNRISIFFYKYKKFLPAYTETDLVFPGVTIEKMEFDQLITYFDYFYSDLSNAVFVTPEEFQSGTFKVRAAQKRLNHKPFTYKIYVNSDKETEVMVKMFLGPKFDQYDRFINFTESRMNFVQFDHFKYTLKTGQNVIVKTSKQIYNYMHDRTTFLDVYKKVLGTTENFDHFHTQLYYGFPYRYLLPKGTYNGMTYQFYVFICPFVPYKGKQMDVPMVGSGLQFLDGYPLGYPLDRPIDYEKMFYHIPNSYFHEVKIYLRDYDQSFTKV